MSVRRSIRWLALLALVALGFFVHRSALGHEFVSWDDDINLYANPNLIVGDIRWGLPWREPYQGLWVPVTYTVWGAIAAVTRTPVGPTDYALHPAPFHAVSLALHLASTALVFVLLSRWLSSDRSRRHTLAAFTGALLFSLHPIQVEAVHWATSLKDTLSVFLAVASLVAAPTSPTRFGARLLLAWLLFALALAAKPAVVVLPVVWLLFSLAHTERAGRWTWIHFTVQLGLAALTAVVARSAQPGGAESTPPELLQRVWISIDSLGFYVTRVLTPVDFCPDYGRTPEWVLEQGVSATFVVGCALLLLLVACALLQKWRTLAILLVFPAVLGPVLGLLPFSHQSISTVTDRYAYLAMLAPAYGLAWLVTLPRFGRVWPLALALLGFCGLLSVRAGEHWQTTTALWENVLRVNPRSASAWTNLGFQLESEGRDAEAIEYYEQSIAVSPHSALAYNNIGNIHFRADRQAEAFEAYTRARRANPKDLHARNNLGVIHHQRGELGAAEALFRAVVETNPNFAPAHQNRGLVALERGELELAEHSFAEALRVDPGFTRARRGLARTLVLRGADPEARSELSRASGTEPGTAEFELEWAALLSAANRSIDELRSARWTAYECGARDPEFLAKLGVGLFEGDQLERALPVLEDALASGAAGLEPRLALATLYRSSERWNELRDLLVGTVKEFSFAPAAWHELALYHRQSGELDKARRAVETALRLDPAYAPSVELAAELELSRPPK